MDAIDRLLRVALLIVPAFFWCPALAQDFPTSRSVSSCRSRPAVPRTSSSASSRNASPTFEGRNGLPAPAKTPRAVIDKLARETAAAVRHPDVQKRFSDLAAEPVGSSPEEQKAMYLRQMKQFTPVIREMKLD